MSGRANDARARGADECVGAGHAPGRTMGVMHVMMAHGRRAAAAAAAYKLRRRDLVKLVVRHITGGFTAPGGGKRRETRLWELDGPVPRRVLKYTRGHQVREGRAGL